MDPRSRRLLAGRARLWLLLAVVFASGCRPQSESPAENGPAEAASDRRLNPQLAAQLQAIENREREMAETVWAREMLAQECGRTFERWWDALNAASNRWAVAAGFRFGEIVIGQPGPAVAGPHGIEIRESIEPGPVLSPDAWRSWLESWQRAGWEPGPVEFRHLRFDADATGRPGESRFGFTARLVRRVAGQAEERVSLDGELWVTWGDRDPDDGSIAVRRIDASRVVSKHRRGEAPFDLVFEETVAPPANAHSIDPLVAYDLDGDGRSELVLAARNLVFRREADGFAGSAPLCRHPPGLISIAVMGDFDGDGAVDFLGARSDGLVLVRGSATGTFEEPGRVVWSAPSNLRDAMVLTCGDADADGDLDLFLGQYRVPYELGNMPTPYYDANDGRPAYFLVNDGDGRFRDGTVESGLVGKRGRRTYAASWVDLDADGDLDLAVVSDFAGLDVHRNDGRGRFEEVTGSWFGDTKAFGMAHAVSDFDADGRLDLLMMGMTSPTVSRLEHLGLWRPGSVEDRGMRSRMTRGSRLYLGRGGGRWIENELGASIAASGWSWGCSAFDFDNDGFPDVYVANGLESRATVREYEGEFWLHDAHVATSEEASAPYLYFMTKFNRTRGAGHSYGGYEKNRLYLNRGGGSFLEIGHLAGVGLEDDSRNVVADDLDGDGRMDLVVTSFGAWPQSKQNLRVYRNVLEGTGHWIGFRFREGGSRRSPVGVRVELRAGGRTAVRTIVTGDSYRSQHPNTVHFGLGDVARVDEVTIRWIGGRSMTLRGPDIDRYHEVVAVAADGR